jgi:hypothetical protein
MAEIDPLAIVAGVREQIRTYNYLDGRETSGLIGTALSVEWIEKGLEEFSRALIEPYWLEVEIRDNEEQRAKPLIETCLIVADDTKGNLLAFVPSEDKFTVVCEFSVGTFSSFGLDGDAVGAFLSR